MDKIFTLIEIFNENYFGFLSLKLLLYTDSLIIVLYYNSKIILDRFRFIVV